MPLLDQISRRHWKTRLVEYGIYLTLIIGGLTMVYPFLVMLTGASSASLDFQRRSMLPGFLFSREDRFLRVLGLYFPPEIRLGVRHMQMAFPKMPEDWGTWLQIGMEPEARAWAGKEFARLDEPASRAAIGTAARDYADFVRNWDLRETVAAFEQRHTARFLRARYGSLEALNAAWETSVSDFYRLRVVEWSGEPVDQPGFFPADDVRSLDFLAFREAARSNSFGDLPGGAAVPASLVRPAAMRFLWEDFVARNATDTPEIAAEFPLRRDAPPATREVWERFLLTSFPLRHVAVPESAERTSTYQAFLVERFLTVETLNEVLGTSFGGFEEIGFSSIAPGGELSRVWMDFVRREVPPAEWVVRDSLADLAFQNFALRRHGSLEKINHAYGLDLANLGELRLPIGEAILETFRRHEYDFAWDLLAANYRTALDYLILRGRAFWNTVILIVLALAISVTVNPLAGYALSRFRLRSGEFVTIFCLATMAFPAAVSAIPGFLLLRDLGMLNTFWALVLPTAANGMAIFLFKGFFDSMPTELFEAATIDGASEMRIFFQVAMPLVQPILAVGMLNAFIAAYNGWEWALIVCQNQDMWTISVWTYQMYQTFQQPGVSMAAFVITSIPVLLVFVFCQRVILRGIVLPQMK